MIQSEEIEYSEEVKAVANIVFHGNPTEMDLFRTHMIVTKLDDYRREHSDSVLVPKVPTSAMKEAFLDGYKADMTFSIGYKAMLKVATDEV